MQISSADYEQFKNILEKQSGILLGDNKQYLVTSRLAGLVEEEALGSIGNLVENVARPNGGRLLKKVVDRMTTNETLWFRDKYPFEYLKTTIVPEWRRRSSSLKIWSAACSTGQEPYSIAINLENTGCLSNSEIIATDLSERVLTKAKQGIYQQIELNRGMPKEQLERYFKPHEKGAWEINARLKGRVRFQSLNLLSVPYMIGKFEIIFCRNVLIYFSKENKTRVLNGLIDNLKPGGYLFLGASETLTRDCQPMEMVRCNPGLVYRKPG